MAVLDLQGMDNDLDYMDGVDGSWVSWGCSGGSAISIICA